MHRSDTRKWRAKTIACASILAFSVFGLGASVVRFSPRLRGEDFALS